MRQTVGILSVPIDRLDAGQVLQRLEQFIHERTFHQVATANTDFLVNAMDDPELRHILCSADLVIPDGMPLVWASRLMGAPLPERVTGADLVPLLAALAAKQGYRIFMLGARPEVARRAKEQLERDYPGIQIVGCVSPPPAPTVEMEHERLLDQIVRARPEILLVALGNPKQEKWIHLNRDRLHDVPVCIGVGATFDFLAGAIRRAPIFAQRNGLEWLYRLQQDPCRLWRRYCRDFSRGGAHLMRQWWLLRSRRSRGVTEMHRARIGNCTVISLKGKVTGSAAHQFQEAAEEALHDSTHLILDLQNADALDCETLGTLMHLPHTAAAHGQEARLMAVSPCLAPLLRHSQLHAGLYQMDLPSAQTFAGLSPAGLRWKVLCGRDVAVVTVSGAADDPTLCLLENVCAFLLDRGLQVELDTCKVTYVDSSLLAMLYNLERTSRKSSGQLPSLLRLVPGPALRQVLIQEKIAGGFTLMNSPSPVSDGIVMPELSLQESLESERKNISTTMNLMPV